MNEFSRLLRDADLSQRDFIAFLKAATGFSARPNTISTWATSDNVTVAKALAQTLLREIILRGGLDRNERFFVRNGMRLAEPLVSQNTEIKGEITR